MKAHFAGRSLSNPEVTAVPLSDRNGLPPGKTIRKTHQWFPMSCYVGALIVRIGL